MMDGLSWGNVYNYRIVPGIIQTLDCTYAHIIKNIYANVEVNPEPLIDAGRALSDHAGDFDNSNSFWQIVWEWMNE